MYRFPLEKSVETEYNNRASFFSTARKCGVFRIIYRGLFIDASLFYTARVLRDDVKERNAKLKKPRTEKSGFIGDRKK